VKVKALPAPVWLDAATLPPADSTMFRTTKSPRPVPLPGSLVVWKGSKMRSIDSAGIPVPLSSTVHEAVPAAA